MTRDLRYKVLGEKLGEELDCYGVQYAHKEDIVYVFRIHNGDPLSKNSIIFETEEQANQYAEKLRSSEGE
jgi:hypothetical protein